MFFRKINEVVESFRHQEPVRSISDEIDDYGNSMKNSIEGKIVESVATVGVYLVVVIPSSYLLLTFLHKLTNIGGVSLGMVGIGLSFLWSIANNLFHDWILKKIPFHVLNPFFGSKIEETFLAFKRQK